MLICDSVLKCYELLKLASLLWQLNFDWVQESKPADIHSNQS